MNPVKISRALHKFGHRLHWIAICAAFLALINVKASWDDGALNIRLRWSERHFELSDHGIYCAIVVASLGGFVMVKVHTRSNANTRLEDDVPLLDQCDFYKEYASKDVFEDFGAGSKNDRLVLNPVDTVENFKRFIECVDRAYPSGVLSPMTQPERQAFYMTWLKSGQSSIALVSKTSANGETEIVGFFAACPITQDAFARLVRGETQGREISEKDIETGKTGDTVFIDIRHCYIRHGEVPPRAMAWLFARGLRKLIRDDSTTVLYGHTVSETGAYNLKQLGFSGFGETPHNRNQQFVLDGRRDWSEQTEAARWTLVAVCGVRKE